MAILIIGSHMLRFFCVTYGICAKKLYPLGSFSDLVSHRSINQCVVNGRDAMTVHSRDINIIVLFFLLKSFACFRPPDVSETQPTQEKTIIKVCLILVHVLHCVIGSYFMRFCLTNQLCFTNIDH